MITECIVKEFDDYMRQVTTQKPTVGVSTASTEGYTWDEQQWVMGGLVSGCETGTKLETETKERWQRDRDRLTICVLVVISWEEEREAKRKSNTKVREEEEEEEKARRRKL